MGMGNGTETGIGMGMRMGIGMGIGMGMRMHHPARVAQHPGQQPGVHLSPAFPGCVG